MPINSTPGDPAAVSYVSLADANAYFAAAFNRQAWGLLTEAVGESLLVSATRYIDQFMKFEGSKSTETQALKFPRKNCVDDEGALINDTVIPNQLKFATYELAWYLNTVGELKFTDSGKTRVKVAVIDLHYKPFGNDLGIPSFIENMLSSFGEPNFQGGGMIKTVRLERS